MEADGKKEEEEQNGGEEVSLRSSGECGKAEEMANGDEDGESNTLLAPRKGGMSRKTNKTRRKVQWNDRNGNKLVEVLEYEPSDVSDSDDEDVDTCICLIM
ncbi:uncharacterized protein LOC126790749 [Argentina anserina]|uniref:uncharacterized protein LOC126790749 n=1 Tax=Argentina anserina TaxID=57926 RepID=UPI002176467C|nr:uncharacterized protein LOC126790749 [Potentilla anserina]